MLNCPLMHPAIPHLLELQRLDLQIATLRAAFETNGVAELDEPTPGTA